MKHERLTKKEPKVERLLQKREMLCETIFGILSYLIFFFLFSGTICAVCLTSIPFRLGKQAYVCRDCQLTCHKPCHIKVVDHCMETSLPKMEL